MGCESGQQRSHGTKATLFRAWIPSSGLLGPMAQSGGHPAAAGERVVVGNVAEEKRGRRPSSSGEAGRRGHVGFGSMFDGETGNGFSLN